MGDENCADDTSRQLVASAKKLYSTIQDLGVQIDSMGSRCLGVEELFAPEIQSKRLALKDACERLFNLSPKAYGAVAREKLWRFALYEAVNRARKIQRDRQWTRMELGLVKTHLQSGIGILELYSMKLKTLCTSSADPVIIRSNILDCLMDNSGSDGTIKISEVDRDRSWITGLVHLCTINVGDLYRYLKEIHTKAQDQVHILEWNFHLSAAQSHYMQAFLLRPDSGLAFNQLGNLYCDMNCGLQAVYYLLYSVQSTNAYEGAYSNLRQLLDRKIVQYARLPASVEPKPIDTLVNCIFSLLYHFLYEQAQLQSYERNCQEALTNFNERLLTCDPEMDEKFLYHLSSICVMAVWRLQATNSVHTSAAVAFAISVFCQLINHLASLLEQHCRVRPLDVVPTPASVASISPMPSDVERASVVSSCNMDKEGEVLLETCTKPKESDDEDKNGFMVPKRRKKRRPGRGIDSDSESCGSHCDAQDFVYYSDEEEIEDSDESEGEWDLSDDDEEGDYEESIPEQDDYEKSSLRGGGSEKGGKRAFDSSSSNGHSDTSGCGRRGADGVDAFISQDPETEIQAYSEEGHVTIQDAPDKQRFMIDKEDLMKCRSQVEPVLVALSPFLRWIQASPVIKNALAANAEKVFLEKFCTVLNLLVSQNWPSILDDISLGDELRRDWKKLCHEPVNETMVFNWELEEDRSMLGISKAYDYVKDLRLKAVTPMDALVIRMGRMIAFGSWLVSTEGFSVLYKAEELNYFVATPQTLKAYLLNSKLQRLKERMGNSENEALMDKLSKAYQDMKVGRNNDRRRHRRRSNRDDDDGPDSGRRSRRRRRGGRGRRGPPCSDPIYAVVDLDAILKRCRDVKRIASNKKFVIVVPHSVWKTLDMLKDGDEEDSPNARQAFRWIETSLKRRHPGVVLQKDQQRIEINFPYPKDPVDVDAWEYYDMMECCNFIITSWLKNKPRSNEVIWGDVRDKCRVFFLTGQEALLNTKVTRSFDPVKIARNVGIYVDFIVPYPGLGRGKKWKSVATTNG